MAGTRRQPDSSADRDLPPIFVSTGCTSSDIMLAPVLAALKRRRKIGRVVGVGGAPLRELGVELFYDSTPVSSVGYFGSIRTVMKHASSAVTAYRQVANYLRRESPALVILVDNAGLNLRLLSLAHQHGARVLYYIPPEHWSIWRWEARAIVNKSTVIAPIFQGEELFYKEKGGRVEFVGHPMMDLLRGARPTANQEQGPRIALFPGSRPLEVQQLLPVLRGAAGILLEKIPDARFVLCSANDVTARQMAEDLPRWTVPVEIVHRQSHRVLSESDLLLTCSGTATLEAAVLGVPMVTMYRLTDLMDRFIQWCVLQSGRYPYFSLPNYLLHRPIVPELRGPAATPARVAAEALELLRNQDRREETLEGLREFTRFLGPPGAIERTTRLIEGLLDDWTAERSRKEAA